MTRRTVLLATLAVLLAAAVGVAIVAGADGGGAGTQAGTISLPNNDSVTLEPADGPNGAYASLDGDGELRIDLTDLNSHGRTTADEVFEITADANTTLEVAVESSSDVSFYWGSNPQRDAVRDRVLEGGESVSVGVDVQTADDAAGGNFTVIVDEYTELDDEDEDEDDDAVEIGPMERDLHVTDPDEPARIAVPVRNPGSRDATETYELSVDGVVVDSRAVTIPARETTMVVFERSFQQSGTYDIAVNGWHVGTVTVEIDAFEVSDASLSPDVIQRGETTTVTAEVTNRGDEAGSFAAELAVGGAVVDRQSVYVEPGRTETVSFERQFDRRGGFEVAVSGEPAGTLQVESAYGASLRRYGSEYGPLLGVLSIPALGGAIAVARSHDVVLVPRPAS